MFKKINPGIAVACLIFLAAIAIDQALPGEQRLTLPRQAHVETPVP